MLKSTKRKLITSLISLSACLSMIGVGFSAWSAGGGSASQTGSGDLVTDDFSKISARTDSIAVDPFCQDGFVTDYADGYKIVYEGHIKVCFSLDFSNYMTACTVDVSAVFTSSGNVNPTIYFDLGGVTSWTYGYGTSENPTLGHTGSALSGATATVSYGEISVSSTTAKLYFGMDFDIQSTAADFNTNVYAYLSDAKFTLDITYTIK